MSEVVNPRRRDFGAEYRRIVLRGHSVTDHPFATRVKALQDAAAAAGGEEDDVIILNDPLSSASRAKESETLDPLHQIAATSGAEADSADSDLLITKSEGFMPWKSKKSAILAKYTTTELEAVKANFVAEDELPTESALKPTDRTQQRLAQLDTEHQQNEQTKMMTQKQYVAHLEMQNKELKAAWAANERRRSLIIVIQSAKLLGGTTISRFYPSKYVLITDVLDTFGHFVFQRLRVVGFMDNKSAMNKFGKGKDDFEAANSVARNLVRNWFYKISSIRELIPRLYVEIAFLPCYQFLAMSSETMDERLMRLARMIRGVGNPLIATYVRSYLVRKAIEVHPKSYLYLLQCMFDFFFSFKDIRRKQTESSKLKMSWDNYMDIYNPALDWLFQCLGQHASRDSFLKLVAKYEESCNAPNVLSHIIQNFPPEYISENAVRIAGFIRDSDSASSFPKYQLWATLCTNLILHPPASVLPPLNAIWRCVSRMENAEHYMIVAEIMVDYPLRMCSTTEVSVFVSDVVRHVTENRAYEKLQPQMQSLVTKIVSHYSSTQTMKVLAMLEPFQRLLDCFVQQTKLDVLYDVVAAYVADKETTTDTVVVHWIFTLCKTLHDSVSAMSSSDHVRKIGGILSTFLYRVDYERDVEAELNFLVLCRQSFPNLDEVQRSLVIRVCGLAMRTLTFARGKHTSKSQQFVAACLAYCYITIPSIEGVFPVLRLHFLCAQVALANNLLSQTDHFLACIIEQLIEVPATLPPAESPDRISSSSEGQLVEFVTELLGFMYVSPGHPDHGAYYMLAQIINALDGRGATTSITGEDPNADPGPIAAFVEGSDGKVTIWISVLQLLLAMRQEKYLYHIAGVESNDILYAGDEESMEQSAKLIGRVSECILSELAQLGKLEAKLLQFDRARELLELLIYGGDIRPSSYTQNLAFNIFNLLRKLDIDNPVFQRLLKTLHTKLDDDMGAAELLVNLEGFLHRVKM